MDEKLVNKLAEHARTARRSEEARLDERWDRFAAGELSTEEAARLHEEAMQNPGGAEAWEAFRPLDKGFDTTLAARLEKLTSEPLSRPAPFWTRWFVWAPMSAAAAIGVLAWIFLAKPIFPTLPNFEIEVCGQLQEVRGGEAHPANAPLHFQSGSRLEISLRPENPVTGPVQVAAFLKNSEGVQQPFSIPYVVSDQGTIKLSGVIGQDITIPPGSWTLTLSLARTGEQSTTHRFSVWIVVETR